MKEPYTQNEEEFLREKKRLTKNEKLQRIKDFNPKEFIKYLRNK